MVSVFMVSVTGSVSEFSIIPAVLDSSASVSWSEIRMLLDACILMAVEVRIIVCWCMHTFGMVL